MLLDINLGAADPAHTGLGLARHLGGPAAPPFVFLTAYSDFDTIRQATQLRPSGYLIKPVNPAALFATIQTALEYAATRQPAPLPGPAAEPRAPAPDFFFVKLADHTHKVLWADVLRLEAGKNYVTLRVAGHARAYPLRGSLSYVLDQLVPEAQRPRFIRVNRRQALNVATITGFDAEWVYCGSEQFENGGQVPEQLLALDLAGG